MDENFKYLADQIRAGLHEIAEAIGQGGGGVTPPPPPADDYRTTYKIKENDANPNGFVIAYKSPDVNETNKERIFAANNSVTVYDRWQEVPGHPVWSAMSEVDRARTYAAPDGWRAIDCTITKMVNGANGLPYAFPTIRYASGETPKVGGLGKQTWDFRPPT